MTPQSLIQEIQEKYSEWLEMTEDNPQEMLLGIMAKLLLIERQDKEFYKKVAHDRFITE